MNYLKTVKILRKRKYSNYLNLKKTFIESYFQSRLKFINQINDLKIKKIINSTIQIEKQQKINNSKKINTFIFFYKTYQSYIKNKKISKNKKKIIYSFYKKYESNLSLKNDYNNKLKKLSKKETKLYSYIFLGYFLKFLNEINDIQKLNCLIKLNDNLILNKSKINNKYFYKLFLENIKFEAILIKKI